MPGGRCGAGGVTPPGSAGKAPASLLGAGLLEGEFKGDSFFPFLF